MKLLNHLRKLYSNIISQKSETQRIVTTTMYQQLYLNNFEKPKLCIDRDRDLIVSLTSYGEKLHKVYLTIESLFHQTVKPGKIILWLDENKYHNEKAIPNTLLNQTSRGLEIQLCKDVKSHTKLVPAILKYPNSPIITIDDDILYPIDFIEQLVKRYEFDGTKIYFYRGHQISFYDNDCSRPRPYLDWVKLGAKGTSIFNVPTGVRGILYPPHCLHDDVCNDKLFLKLCPYADDIWFKVMSLLKGTECELISTIHPENQFISLDIDENTSLQSRNVKDGMNDVQIKELFNYYNLTDIFKNFAKEGKL